MSGTQQITAMLHKAMAGDTQSAGALMDAVYTQLRNVAKRYMAAEQQNHTLQPTAIVNEVFLRLFMPAEEGHWKSVPIDWQSRAHFLGVAAKQMRLVLVDYARQKRAVKRNFGVKVSLDDANPGSLATSSDPDFGAIDRLLTVLEGKDPAAARVVELRFFGGLTNQEIAHVTGANVPKVRRDWEFAKSWLRQRL